MAIEMTKLLENRMGIKFTVAMPVDALEKSSKVKIVNLKSAGSGFFVYQNRLHIMDFERKTEVDVVFNFSRRRSDLALADEI